MTLTRRFGLLLFTILLLSSTADAAWWWPFGTKASEATPTVQSERARPIFEKAVAAEQKGSLRSAARSYRKVYRRYPAADTAAQALYNYGSIQYKQKNWKKAYIAFQQILGRHPDFPRFNEIVRHQFNIALAAADGDGFRFMWIIPYRAYNTAIGYFEVVINNAPYNDLAPLALMNVALIHQHKGNTAEAIDALDRLINNYPGSLLASDAYIGLAETFAELVDGPLYDQGATREAISYFEDFIILYSQSEDVARAEEGLAEMQDLYSRSKLVIGEYYFKYRRWYDAATIFYNEAITIAPDSPSAARARERITEIEQLQAEAAAEAATRDPEDAEKERFFLWRWLNLRG